jgi:mono/diheme cytochrome c family protein
VAGEAAAVAIALAVSVAALALGVAATFAMGAVQRRLTPNPNAALPIAALAALPILDADEFVRGRGLFTSTCATCHAAQGTGVPGLGKDLTHSLFVCELDDVELVAFLKRGREANDPLNTTRVPMPPRGGNPNLTDPDLASIALFVRGLQDPRRVPDVPPMSQAPIVVAAPTAEDKAKALAAAGGDAELAEWIAHGGALFAGSCASCHGKDAHGMPGLGKDLTTSPFVKSLDDDGLLAFLMKGRDPSDPLNTTKIAMPPKGGNPALSEDDLLDIIAHLRSLQPPPGATPSAPPSATPEAPAK